MSEPADKPLDPPIDPNDRVDLWDFPPTDESGNVDIEQIRYNLSLTPGERLAQNDRALEFVEALRDAGRKFYGR